MTIPNVATIHQALGMWVHPDDPIEEKQKQLAKARNIAERWQKFARTNRIDIVVYPFLLETTSPPYARNGYYEYRKTELREQASAAYPGVDFTHWISGNANTGMGAWGYGILGGRYAMCSRYAPADTYYHEGSTGHNGVTHLFDWPDDAPTLLKRMRLKGRKHSGVWGNPDPYSDAAFTIMASSGFGAERRGFHAWDLIMLGRLMPTEYRGPGVYRIAHLGIHPEALPEGYIACLLYGSMAIAPRRDTGTTSPVSKRWANKVHLVDMDSDKQTWRHGAYPEGEYPLGNGVILKVVSVDYKGATVEISE